MPDVKTDHDSGYQKTYPLPKDVPDGKDRAGLGGEVTPDSPALHPERGFPTPQVKKLG